LQVLDRINVNRDSILGVEVSGRWRIDPAFSVRGNMTYLDSEQKSGPNKGAPLALTPKWKGNVRGDWDISQATRLWTSINYYGREYQALITGGSAPAYLTADLLGSHDLGRGFRVQGGIYNVGDKRLDDATYGTVNYGRTFWMGVSANF